MDVTQVKFIKVKKIGGIFSHNLDGIEEQYETLPAGMYVLEETNNGIGYFPFTMLDKLITFKKGAVAESMETLMRFFDPEVKEVYKNMEIGHKMGVLFYGKQGVGKTSACNLLMKQFVEKVGAVCLIATNVGIGAAVSAAQKIRKVQDSPIVILMDEFEQKCRGMNEFHLLTFLDGTDSIDDCMLIGCTNFINEIPDRVKKRRSRIKHLIEISSFPYDVYREYAASKLPAGTDKEVEAKFALLAEENGLTLDELKHSLIDHVVEGSSVEDAITNSVDYKINTKSVEPEIE